MVLYKYVSTVGLVVECMLATHETRVRFPDGAYFYFIIIFFRKKCRKMYPNFKDPFRSLYPNKLIHNKNFILIPFKFLCKK